MDFLSNLPNLDQLLEPIAPLIIFGLIIYIIGLRQQAAKREQVHQEEVYRMNRERSEWRVRKQQHQAAISDLEGKIQQKQDVIDKLTRTSMPEFFHLN